MAKELLNWVEPRRVLGIEEDGDLEFAGSLEYDRVLVDDRIVHQQDYVLVLSGSACSKVSERIVDEVLEEDRVNTALNDLARYDFVLAHRSNQ